MNPPPAAILERYAPQMKLFFYPTTILFLCTFSLVTNNSCQSNSKKENVTQKETRVFDKKPKFDTLLNGFAKPIGYVSDYGSLYTSEQVFNLDSLLYDFETKTSIQLVVVTFDSIMAQASEVDKVTTAIGIGWQVGGVSSNGIIIGISKVYRRIRIQNGKPIQKLLSDSATKTIIDTAFIPEFKKDHYFEGTKAGLKSLMNTLQNALTEKAKVEF